MSLPEAAPAWGTLQFPKPAGSNHQPSKLMVYCEYHPAFAYILIDGLILRLKPFYPPHPL
jgi:hypothetical protein